MNKLFKLKSITIKNDIVNIYFSGNHNMVTQFLFHQEIKDATLIVGTIEKSTGLSAKMIEATNSMILQEDYTLFKDMLGEYTKCEDSTQWGTLLFANMPSGVITVDLELKFNKEHINEIVTMFGFVVDFQKEIESRLKDL